MAIRASRALFSGCRDFSLPMDALKFKDLSNEEIAARIEEAANRQAFCPSLEKCEYTQQLVRSLPWKIGSPIETSSSQELLKVAERIREMPLLSTIYG